MEQLAERFYMIHEEIAEINSKLKALRDEKDTTGNLLLKEMERQNVESLKIKEKSLCIKTSSVAESLNQSYLHESLSSFFKVETKSKDKNEYAESAVNFILDNRSKTDKKTIKILNSKN